MRLKCVILLAVLVSSRCSAQEPSQSADAEPRSLESLLLDLCSGDRSIQSEAIQALTDLRDPRALAPLTALRLGALYLWTTTEGTGKVVIGGFAEEDETGERYLLPIRDPLTDAPILDESGAPLRIFRDELEKASVNNRLRRIIRPALDRLSLLSSDPEARRPAAVRLGMTQSREVLPMLEKALAREESYWTRHALEEAIWIIQLTHEDESVRRSAAEMLATLHAPNGLVFMQNMLETDENGETLERSETVRETLKTCVARIQRYQLGVELVSTGFYGISLGAVLMMIALGLAITFGLMGVINMAHGELMLVGAYTAYVTQALFKTYLSPEVFDWYFLLALPLAFLMAALVGLILETGILRFLYGRPLETLLLTWGISLILQQLARHIFGAANVDVTSPSFLRGGMQVMVGLVLPYNRLFIIGFSFLCLSGTYLILFRTALGLRIRAVTQNREISACLGIATRRVDALTFAFGAGLAGIAGCELSALGNVGPDLGQTYIVDSFMVVVLGGVGKLIGTVWAAFGIGMISKTIEPFADAVMGKVIVLVLVVLFLQRRPGGIFPAKGRQADG